MKSLPVARSTQAGTNDLNEYSGVVLSSNAEIREVSDDSRLGIPQDDPMLTPAFFLASVAKGWEPRVVTVSNAREIVGILYTKERVIAGLPTGVVYADGSLGQTVLAHPLHQQKVFRVAVETLLASPKIHGVRLRILRRSRETGALRQLIASRPVDVHYSRIKYNNSRFWKHNAHLTLANSYEQFLTSLGSATRHNFRDHRRRFEKSGHSLIEDLSMDELRSAATELALAAKSKFQPSRIEIDRHLNMVAATRRPLAVGLKHHNGEWLSVIGGWHRPGGAVLLFQYNNDRNFSRDSLSIVLRGYFIEALIRQQLKEVVFLGGTAPPLSRYVTYRPTIGVHLDAPTYVWRVARFLLSRIGPWLPKRLAAAAQWVA